MSFDPTAEAYDDEIRKKDTVIAVFEIDAVELTAKSEEAGSPVFEEREFVVLRHPGDRSYEHREVVRTDHLAVAQDRRTRQHVLELADVARPAIAREPGERLRRDLRRVARLQSVRHDPAETTGWHTRARECR